VVSGWTGALHKLQHFREQDRYILYNVVAAACFLNPSQSLLLLSPTLLSLFFLKCSIHLCFAVSKL